MAKQPKSGTERQQDHRERKRRLGLTEMIVTVPDTVDAKEHVRETAKQLAEHYVQSGPASRTAWTLRGAHIRAEPEALRSKSVPHSRSMTNIHPTAIVHPETNIGEGAIIGPYCCLGKDVKLGNDVQLLSHVVVEGRTRIGDGTKIFPFASIGYEPQDLKFHGEESELIIGNNNTIREHVTMNPGTQGGGMVTRIGNGCLFMMGAHVAHDCQIGNNVILVNNATLAGHVEIGDWALVGGLSAVHQFVRIGRHAMIGGMSGIENDVIPYGLVMGNRAHLSGLNLVGLKRRKIPNDVIHDLRRAYRLIFAQEGTQAERLADVADLFSHVKPVKEIVSFMNKDSNRAICQPLFEAAGEQVGTIPEALRRHEVSVSVEEVDDAITAVTTANQRSRLKRA